MRLVRAQLAKHRRWFAGVTVFQLVSVTATLYLPTINADLIDNGLLRTDVGHIWTAGGWMVVVSIVQLLAAVVSSYAGTRAATNAAHDLRSVVYDKIATFSSREHQDFGTPTLITRSTDDVQQIQAFLLTFGTVVVAAPITMLGGAFMALRADPGLSFLIVVAVVALGAALAVILRWMTRVSRRMQDRLDAINRVMREQLMGLTVIRAFTRERFEAERFGQVNDGRAGADRGDRRRVGLREDDPDEPADAVPRRGQWTHPRRRHRHHLGVTGHVALRGRARSSRAVAVRRNHSRQHRLRAAGCHT
ncbi:UNVERIFIED_CONTAM: ABC-type multidrug transport system fused ATPase/permease subunit [Streptomyces canus]